MPRRYFTSPILVIVNLASSWAATLSHNAGGPIRRRSSTYTVSSICTSSPSYMA
ncbi:hypothetical protein PF002_g13307 [Phytophthora fragariae]|uniref:RxLR effector protein n=1 Tax=Phytophthora fragariae TaxID=53985 RepID=A0A6A3Z2S5_9STRA|nr:hypothetical protein PF002_g13307 [Phytophthora fragariae]KAE9259602.1 hypothetical protein PF008_g33319 [Phytophthora fragariae]